MDLPVCEIPKMKEKYTERILLDVKRIVGEIFGKKKEALALRPRSWKEPHMVRLCRYQSVHSSNDTFLIIELCISASLSGS